MKHNTFAILFTLTMVLSSFAGGCVTTNPILEMWGIEQEGQVSPTEFVACTQYKKVGEEWKVFENEGDEKREVKITINGGKPDESEAIRMAHTVASIKADSLALKAFCTPKIDEGKEDEKKVVKRHYSGIMHGVLRETDEDVETGFVCAKTVAKKDNIICTKGSGRLYR